MILILFFSVSNVVRVLCNIIWFLVISILIMIVVLVRIFE